jgi:hypothetical protein
LQATTNYAEGVDYVASVDVTRDIDSLPVRVEDLVMTELVADLIRDVVEGLLGKARIQGERTGTAYLGPPTYLTAEGLEAVHRQLDTDRPVL